MYSLKKAHIDHVKNKPNHVKTNSLNMNQATHKTIDKQVQSNKNTNKFINANDKNSNAKLTKTIKENSSKQNSQNKKTFDKSKNNSQDLKCYFNFIKD
jgi:hypothetical protein